jgi:hypothetical protein
LDKIEISKGTLNDIKDVMSFIDLEWRKNHILSQNEILFRYDYQYDNELNFIVARENKSREIVGVLGFIPSSIIEGDNYSSVENSDYCASLWKVKKNIENPIVGIQLLQVLRSMNDIGVLFSLGINEKTIGIYKYLGIYTDSLRHFVIINEDIREFKIADFTKISSQKTTNILLKEDYCVKLINDQSELSHLHFDQFRNNIPFKNEAYFIKRYFNHPIYEYTVLGAYLNNDLEGFFVTRIQTHFDARVLRIVDFIGKENCISSLGKFVADLIIENCYEYADFYCFGIDNDVLLNSGFQLVDPLKEDLIIPNYFSPYSQKNISIHFYADTDKIENIKLFKGDGDQDRPN